ncbi:MAG: hypothetical protein C0616_06650 [Desulfuromonas sp.]|nr:MAG: hypothetical protein C0616_06650 [Desulfuromonas sp.]
MTNKTLSPGDILDAYCTKCRKMMNHTLIALVDEKPSRVKCNTCEGEHNFRNPPKTKKSASSGRTTAAATKKALAIEAKKTEQREEWEKSCAALANTSPTTYSMDIVVKAKTLVQHKKFGLGVVQNVIGENKMTVLFQDGEKLLRCG